jgi:hypothetical protein
MKHRSRGKRILVLTGSLAAAVIVALVVLAFLSNRLVKGQIEKALGRNGRIERVSLGWDSIDLYGLHLLKDGKDTVTAEKIEVRASFFAALTNKITVSRILIDKPSITLTINPDGSLVSPFPEGKKDDKARAGGPAPSLPAFTLGHVAISDGALTVVDRRIKGNETIGVRQIEAEFDDIAFPFGKASPMTGWKISARIPGKLVTGRLEGSGKTNFHDLDTKGRMTLRKLDLVTVSPHLGKKGQAEITGGSLDMDMEMTIKKRAIHAPTHVLIRGLRLASGQGASDRFFGIPRTMVINLLENSKDELPVDFVVEGSLDDPKFSLRESLLRRFTMSLGGKLGLSVIETGEGVIVQGGKVLKSIGTGLRGLFR